MKRLLFSLGFALVAVVSFNSCTKEYITNNNYLPGYSYYLDVRGGSAWQEVPGNLYESYQDIAIADLDERYFVDGEVSVAIAEMNNNGDVVRFINVPGTIGDFHYNVDYSIGKITLYVLDLAARRANDPNQVSIPGPLTIKVVLTDAEIGN